MYRSKYNQKCLFLHLSHTICSEKYIKEETQFLIDMFVENEHKRLFLENLHCLKSVRIRSFSGPYFSTFRLNTEIYRVKKRCGFKDYNAKKNNNVSHNYINSKKIPWVPNIGAKITKKFKKVNRDITFTSGKNLQSILCQNKPKLLI